MRRQARCGAGAELRRLRLDARPLAGGVARLDWPARLPRAGLLELEAAIPAPACAAPPELPALAALVAGLSALPPPDPLESRSASGGPGRHADGLANGVVESGSAFGAARRHAGACRALELGPDGGRAAGGEARRQALVALLALAPALQEDGAAEQGAHAPVGALGLHVACINELASMQYLLYATTHDSQIWRGRTR